MRDPTINVEVEEAIAAAVRVLEGAKWYLKNPCWEDPQESAARDQARRWLVAAIPMLPPRFAPPPGAEELILRRLTGPEPRPPRKKGRYAVGGFKIRDRIIVTAIEFAVKRGFDAMRNTATRDDAIRESSNDRESGCSIVSTALKRLGVKMPESTIQEIWQHRAVRAYSPK